MQANIRRLMISMKILVLLLVCVHVRINTCMTVSEKWCLYESRYGHNRINPDVNPFQRRRTIQTTRAPRVMPEVKLRKKRFSLASIPRRRPDPPTTNEQARSLCSWSWVLDSNSTRLPRNMYKAVCDAYGGHNQCNFDFSIVNNFNTSALDHLRLETECALVKAPVEIQNECCINGNYTILSQWIEWPVACACARKRVYVAPG